MAQPTSVATTVFKWSNRYPTHGYILERQSGYQPDIGTCGTATTCSDACGNGFITCEANSDLALFCYNPSHGQTCCKNGDGRKWCQTPYSNDLLILSPCRSMRCWLLLCTRSLRQNLVLWKREYSLILCEVCRYWPFRNTTPPNVPQFMGSQHWLLVCPQLPQPVTRDLAQQILRRHRQRAMILRQRQVRRQLPLNIIRRLSLSARDILIRRARRGRSFWQLLLHWIVLLWRELLCYA